LETISFPLWQGHQGLREGVHRYAAQVNLQIDAATAKKAVSGRKPVSDGIGAGASAARAAFDRRAKYEGA